MATQAPSHDFSSALQLLAGSVAPAEAPAPPLPVAPQAPIPPEPAPPPWAAVLPAEAPEPAAPAVPPLGPSSNWRVELQDTPSSSIAASGSATEMLFFIASLLSRVNLGYQSRRHEPSLARFPVGAANRRSPVTRFAPEPLPTQPSERDPNPAA